MTFTLREGVALLREYTVVRFDRVILVNPFKKLLIIRPETVYSNFQGK